MNVIAYIKNGLALFGGALAGILGGWDIALKVLILFVVFDYITGLTAAWYEKKLDSNIGMKGIAKKILLFVPVVIGCWLDTWLGQEVLRSVTILFYVVNEGLSIAENLAKVGVPFPPALLDALNQLKKKDE